MLVFDDAICAILDDEQVAVPQNVGKIIYQDNCAFALRNELGPRQILNDGVIQITGITVFAHLLKHEAVVAKHTPR